MPPLLFLSLHILTLFTYRAHSQEESMPPYCSGGKYTSPSPFENTLFRLLRDLTSAVPFSPSLYLTENATVSFPPSKIFALAQCRHDAPALNCTDCLRRSADSVTIDPSVDYCDRTSATVRFDLCILRYSDQPFYGVADLSVWWSWFDLKTAADLLHFVPRVKYLLSWLAQEAAASVGKFATGIFIGDGGGKRIYGLAWCTRDLSAMSCSACLRRLVDKVSVEKIGASVAVISCYVKYDTSPFFNLTLVTSTILQEATGGGGYNFRASIQRNGDARKTQWILVICCIFAAVPLVLFSIISALLILRMKFMCMIFPIKERNIEHLRSNPCIFLELSTVRAATNDFAEENKLGEGGFGAVFGGKLRDGEEIAVKRLSKTSLQGIEELKNEVAFIAKLQHRNLVRLLGCCIDKDENLLIYEFLPNKSLDKFLFDSTRQRQMDWSTRYKIIEGVAQGLLYLQEDSRLRVVHCDLKTSNILLDSSMNPKISDFGYAKLFGINEAQRKASRICGTSGYMAPEYAMHGLFSTKSDVYSYGVIVLEIITGRRSRCIEEELDCLDVLSFAWYNWKQGHALQALDQSLGDRYVSEQAMRCIQIALMCIQEDPAQRPSISSLITMLSSYSVTLPEPLMPSFIFI